MSADTFVAYCGLRFEVASHEIEDVERRTDARIIRAKRFGIKFYYGDFGGDQGEYLLFIGFPIGLFGIENSLENSFSLTDLQILFHETRTKLVEAGFEEDPAFHFRVEPDF